MDPITQGFNPFGPYSSPYPVSPNPNQYSDWFSVWNDYAFNSQDNNWRTGSGMVQFSEWSQQMLSTMYQNWYNSAPEQMSRAMAAGINPFVAASGISGSGTGSVAPAPPSTPNRAAENLNAVAGLGNMLNGGFSSFANGFATLSKLAPEIGKITAETQNIFETLGFTKLQSKAMSISLQYLDKKEQIGVWQALANFEKTSQEYQNLSAGYRNILAQYDEIIAHKDLLIQEQGEVAAREAVNKAMESKLKAETAWQETQNKFFADHGYILGTPIFEGLRDMMVSNGTFDMETFGNEIAGYHGKISSVVESAKASASWNYRPSNLTEAAAYAGSTIGTSLRDLILNSQGVNSWKELYSKLSSNASANREFNEAFNDAKEDLFEEFLSKKRYYRRIRRGGNGIEVARAKHAMETAKSNYEKLTKETFGDELIKSLLPR